MKKVRSYIACLAIIGLVFSSCSKDDDGHPAEPESATLSFDAVLKELSEKSTTKDHLEGLPVCSEENPSYVEIVLTGPTDVGTAGAPHVLNIDASGQTEPLEVQPGTYSLESFRVFDASDVLIWVSPVSGGDFANFVENPLPQGITVAANEENTATVDVLCFDDRLVDQYGDIVFALNSNTALKYCFSAAYCEQPATVSVNMWLGTDNTGTVLYSDVTHPAGEAVCFALPDLEEYADEVDYIYYEVTVQDDAETYGDVAQTMISGALSRAAIQANFVDGDNMVSEPLTFECDGEDEITDPEGALAEGEYVFDFENTADLDWAPAQNASYSVSGSQLNVSFDATQFDGTNKRRADLQYTMNGSLNGEPQEDWIYTSDFPIFAIKITKPETGNMFIDMRGGSFPSSNSYSTDLAEQDVYYWDFSERIEGDRLETDLFQIKIADITSEETGYSVDWIRTFSSVAELQTFLQNEEGEDEVTEPDPTTTAEVLSGTIIGHESSWNDNPDNYINAAFDGDVETFVDGPNSIGHVGYDLGEGNEAKVTSIRFFPRSTHPDRMLNNEFRGSNDPDYMNNYTVLHTITGEPSTSEYTGVNIDDDQEYRYIYMYSTNSTNIAELEFYGVPAN